MDLRRSCNVFPASSRFPATTCPPAGSEETDVSPTGGGRPADTGSISRNSASSFVYNGHEARTTSTTIVRTRTRVHAAQPSRRRQTHNDAFLATRCDAPCRLNVRATSIGNLEETPISYQDLIPFPSPILLPRTLPSTRQWLENCTSRLSVRYIYYLYFFLHIYFYIYYSIFYIHEGEFLRFQWISIFFFLNLNSSRAKRAVVYKMVSYHLCTTTVQ